MLRNLLIAVASIVLVFAILWTVARESDNTQTHQPTEAERLVEQSRPLMPPGYREIAVGMPFEEMRRARPRIRRSGRPGAGPNGTDVWEEDDSHGARVVYLVNSSSQTLSQVQFASRVTEPRAMRGHFAALQEQYGVPSGIWDCPETSDNPAMRRFTWRREGITVMEAALLHNQALLITLVIASTSDVGSTLQRNRCTPMRRGDHPGHIPTAFEVRGESARIERSIPPPAPPPSPPQP